MIEITSAAYAIVGVTLAMRAGAELKDERAYVPWWADLIAFLFTAVLWGPVLLIDAVRGR